MGEGGNSVTGPDPLKPQVYIDEDFPLMFSWSKRGISNKVFCCEVLWLGEIGFLGALSWSVGLFVAHACWRFQIRVFNNT